ncbi:MAG: hypothetical protein J6Q82_04930 [Clostridia bacterium]|nr:hypothetical protein [Clostridia bacterium]
MAKKYVFRYNGTMEKFLNQFNWSSAYFDDKARYKYIDNYILKLLKNKISFGVERGGHSGGYWYVPKITEFDNYIEFEGKIKYVSLNDDNIFIRICDKFGEGILFIILLPIIGIYKLYEFVRILLKKPIDKGQSTEDKLFDLMINYLGCTKV